MDIEPEPVFQERFSLLGHETVKKLRSHEMLVNQRNRVNPVADMLPFAGSTGAA